MNLRERLLKIRDNRDESGRLISFEIANVFVGRLKARSVIRSIPGVRILKEPSFIAAVRIYREDIFIEFELGGHAFHVYEPFADNDCYMIGPDPRKPTEEIVQIRTAFERVDPRPRALGCLVLVLMLAAWIILTFLKPELLQ